MPDQLAPGTVLSGKYRLESLLGKGGMGSVWLAKNLDIGRSVAIKTLHPSIASEPRVAARFKQEAHAAAEIGHPGIVDVLDMGTSEDGAPFIVMEHLQGETLGSRLARETRLSPQIIVPIMAQVLDALAAAHDKGIIHRDLKPDNLFLVGEQARSVKLLDFGISKFTGGASDSASLTSTGVVLGTPLYMAPEQARGVRDLTPAADLYSVGAILHHALAGQPPFPGDSYNEVLSKVLVNPPPPLLQLRPDLAPALAELVDSLLVKEPAQRPSSARRVRDALLALAEPSPNLASTLLATPPPKQPGAARPILATPAPAPIPLLSSHETSFPPAAVLAPAAAKPSGARSILLGAIVGAILVSLGGGAAWFVARSRARAPLPPPAALPAPIPAPVAPVAEAAAPSPTPAPPVAIEREEPAVEEKPAPPPPPRKAVAQQLPRVPKKPALPQLSEEDGTGVKLVLGAGPSETRWSVNGEDLPCNCGCVYMVPMGQKIVLEAHAPGYVPFRREFTARQRVVLAINLKEEKSAKAPAEK